MIGVWVMSLWEQMGQPNRVNLVELGPGRGTLMVDLLRVRGRSLNLPLFFLSVYPDIKESIVPQVFSYIFLSCGNMQGASKFKRFTESLHIHLVECSPTLQKLQHSNLKCVDDESASVEKRTISTMSGTPVSWHATLEQVPSGCMESFPIFIIPPKGLHLFVSFLYH